MVTHPERSPPMTKHTLEPEAQEVADATSKPPFPH